MTQGRHRALDHQRGRLRGGAPLVPIGRGTSGRGKHATPETGELDVVDASTAVEGTDDTED